MGGVGDEVSVTILVDDAHLASIAEVAERLRDAGVVVESQAVQVGVITGRVDAARVPSLGQVTGVQHVEIAHRIQLEPPESDLQ